MKHNFKYMIVLTLWLCLCLSCHDDGINIKENPFENGPFITLNITNTSNADTLFLSWELTETERNFDRYQVEVGKSKEKVKTVGKDERKCFFTHIPYNEPVLVSISLVENDEPANAYSITVKIDGLDKTIARIIIPDRNSVTAGDGMYSIALPDGRSIFLMGDSYIGPVTNGQRSTSDRMYRNTYIVYDNGQVSAIYGANGDNNRSAAVPPCCPRENKWYWPGHGFVNGNILYIFQTLMYQGSGDMWGFMYETTHILEYDLPSLQLRNTTPIPFTGSTDVHYGMAAINDGDYIYIYAQVDIDNSWIPVSEVSVARTTLANLYTGWQYYNGSGWSNNASDAVKLDGLASVPVSSQFNVFKLGDKYVLLTQSKAYWSGEIYTFISNTPYGPWRNKQLVFDTYEQNIQNLFTYNAMAHPQFEKDGMILVSYNVNTEVFAEQFSDVSTYRPRFFWVEINKILNN